MYLPFITFFTLLRIPTYLSESSACYNKKNVVQVFMYLGIVMKYLPTNNPNISTGLLELL